MRLRRLTLLPLVAATYCMVAGGPYGLEEIVSKCGYGRALLLLAILPLLWGAPATLMIAELASALPQEGGYYAWVERALGPFWGFQEAWLSMAASVFDMAIYPTLFALYVQRLSPALGGQTRAILLGLAVIALCTAWNLLGARPVGGASVGATALMLAPFALIVFIAFGSPARPAPRAPLAGADLLGGVLIAMWNYMGWDNASTVAGEVERPGRAYPRAMAGALALVTATYILPIAAAARAGLDPSAWTTGSWADAGRALGGPWLGTAVIAGGAVSAFAMFNALVLSYSRVPFALAEDRLLPRVFARRSRSGAPTVSIAACAVAWALCLALGFDRLIELDILLYGGSLALEFVALVVLRVREPGLARPFRIPGGLAGAVAAGICPILLLGVALARNAAEKIGPVPSLALAGVIVAVGPALYRSARSRRRISSA
jgi:amino acid transporter